MNILGLDRLRQAAQRLWERHASIGIILMYHRVSEGDDPDPWGLRVSPSHFAEHLEILQQRTTPMQLSQFVQAYKDETLPPNAVAITFDDGYGDALSHASPLLEQHEIPATVFLTSGHLGTQREFWWDTLERLLLEADELPTKLELTIQGKTHQWTLKDDGRQRSHWRAWDKPPPSDRHALYYELYQLLIGQPKSERRRILDTLNTWVEAPSTRPTYHPLSVEDAITLAHSDLIGIGAHTVTHPALPSLSKEDQQREIRKSKTQLEQALERSITSFAYPYGRYTGGTTRIVRETGFSCACTTDPDVLHRRADPFRLPRLQVLDWNGEAFAEWLSGRL